MLKVGVAGVVCPNITDYWATLEDAENFCELDLLYKYYFVSRKGEPARMTAFPQQATGVAKTQRRTLRKRLLQEIYSIDGFREAILGGESRLYVLNFALFLALAVVLLASGILYFRKMERTFADVI